MDVLDDDVLSTVSDAKAFVALPSDGFVAAQVDKRDGGFVVGHGSSGIAATGAPDNIRSRMEVCCT